jgi:hypothetical protein
MIVVDDPWALTARISPREDVRVAAVDDTGHPINTYNAFARTDSSKPDRPWAVFLADDHQMFGLLAFDLDTSKGDVLRDCERLTRCLQQLRISYTVAQSGPAGGRHVWLSLAQSAHPAMIAQLAQLARAALPSLDVSPLLNPATGCVRPPGSPHRNGGASTVLSGSTPLMEPTVVVEDLERLAAKLAALADAASPLKTATAGSSAAKLPIDPDGHPYMPGARGPLPNGSARALASVPVNGKADGVAFSVLLGAARAHWHYADVVSLLAEPGMEHFRTEYSPGAGGPGSRRPRSRDEQQTRLSRQWRRAVAVVVSDGPRRGAVEDPTFPRRAAHIAAQIAALQARADSSPGRWNTRTGPGGRRVLDALCLLATTALTTTIEADQRRLAGITGLGRETVRRRLADLVNDGWIQLVVPAAGVHGHTWTLTVANILPGQRLYPHSPHQTWSQGEPPPPFKDLDPRSHLLGLLARKLRDQAHDVFTTAGLGHAAGDLYTRVNSDYVTVTELVVGTGRSPDEVGGLLALLTAAKVVLRDRRGRGWRRPARDGRRPEATRRNLTDLLVRRTSRYQLERQLWAWWLSELEWMRLPHDHAAKRRRRLAAGQLAVDSGLPGGRLPRRSNGRVDFAAARALAA